MVYFLNSPSNNKVGMENAGLSEFSKHTLREMCSQDWVREKFLRDPETLFTPEMLLDSMLSNEQVSIYMYWPAQGMGTYCIIFYV